MNGLFFAVEACDLGGLVAVAVDGAAIFRRRVVIFADIVMPHLDDDKIAGL